MTAGSTSTPMRQMSSEQSSEDWGQGFETVELDVSKVRSILLSDGWHNITSPSIKRFAVGTSQSPFTTPKNKYYPALQYQEHSSSGSTGQTVYTPFNQIISFSESVQG